MIAAFKKTNLLGVAALGFLLASCAGQDGQDGQDGATGPAGPGCTVIDNGDGTKTISCEDGTSATISDGQDVDSATVEEIQAQLEKLASTEPESCAVCHKGAGEGHQAIYDAYSDASKLAMTFDSVVSTDNGDGTYDTTITLTIERNGVPYVDGDGLPTLEQKRFYSVAYDPTTRMFTDSVSFGNITALGNGQYTVSASGLDYAPEDGSGSALVYGYIADGLLNTEPTSGHISLYDDVASAGLSFGGAADYESAATVSGCEKCHGAPYAKHGYRFAAVENLSDFASCKTCHFDDRSGGHEDWQILADNPARYAEIHDGADLTAEEETKYAYTANIMNDVHMSHAMEFPYPQSMANCTTCHEGKLDMVLSDANFNLTTCKSCHPVDGSAEYGTADLALANVIPSWHDLSSTCNSCHTDGGNAPAFNEIHTGYNTAIYAAEGVKYADLFTVSIDSASLDASNVLNVQFTVNEDAASTSDFEVTDIVPTLMVGLYGYDTKDYIVSPHSRDADRNRLLEFPIDGESTNPRFTTVASDNGSFEVNVDLSMWADMIGASVKRAEIAVMPDLRLVVGEKDSHENGESDDVAYALNSVSRTFDLTANSFDDAFYGDIVAVEGCNECHEALGTTFHSPDRGGSIRVCRLCHVPSSRGSHLEMQSRSIDSYVHAIHSFQAFDPGDVDFTDPVEKMRYELHVEHTYPMFTAMNCESCHLEGTYNVPDQSKSLPGILSGSDDVAGRNIGTVAQVATGPATRACGGCHRADLINEDDANGLAAFYAHTKANGYMVEDESGVWEALVETIMSIFE